MRRYLSLLLFIGLAWGQQNANNYFGLFNKENFNHSFATVEEKAEYDAKLKGLKWFLYPGISSLIALGSIKVYFYEINNPSDLGDVIIEGSTVAILSTSITYWFFNKGDKIVYPKDVISEDEKKKYADTFDKKIRKLKTVNSRIGAGVIVLVLSPLTW